LGYLNRNAPIVFLFGLCNAVRTIDRLVAQRMHPSSTDNEFVGMTDYITESFHDLLTGDSEMISNSDSSGGAITLRANASWQTPPRGMLKVSKMGGSLPWLALMTRSRETQGPYLACGWSS
jgi:hypothetical protein